MKFFWLVVGLLMTTVAGTASGQSLPTQPVYVETECSPVAFWQAQTVTQTKESVVPTFIRVFGMDFTDSQPVTSVNGVCCPVVCCPAVVSPAHCSGAPVASTCPRQVDSEQAAQRDLKIADHYKITGMPSSACFFYGLVQKSYPSTRSAQVAQTKIRRIHPVRNRRPITGAEPAEVNEQEQRQSNPFSPFWQFITGPFLPNNPRTSYHVVPGSGACAGDVLYAEECEFIPVMPVEMVGLPFMTGPQVCEDAGVCCASCPVTTPETYFDSEVCVEVSGSTTVESTDVFANLKKLSRANRIYRIGERCLNDGDIQTARNCFQEARERCPGSPVAYRATQQLALIEECIIMTSFLGQHPLSGCETQETKNTVQTSGWFGSACSQAQCQASVASDRQGLAREMYQMAERNRAKGNLDLAYSCYEQTQQICPHSVWARKSEKYLTILRAVRDLKEETDVQPLFPIRINWIEPQAQPQVIGCWGLGVQSNAGLVGNIVGTGTRRGSQIHLHPNCPFGMRSDHAELFRLFEQCCNNQGDRMTAFLHFLAFRNRLLNTSDCPGVCESQCQADSKCKACPCESAVKCKGVCPCDGGQCKAATAGCCQGCCDNLTCCPVVDACRALLQSMQLLEQRGKVNVEVEFKCPFCPARSQTNATEPSEESETVPQKQSRFLPQLEWEIDTNGLNRPRVSTSIYVGPYGWQFMYDGRNYSVFLP